MPRRVISRSTRARSGCSRSIWFHASVESWTSSISRRLLISARTPFTAASLLGMTVAARTTSATLAANAALDWRCGALAGVPDFVARSTAAAVAARA